jgi:uncharacterized protein
MSLLAILLFVGTMALSLWATMRVRQVYNEFSQMPASSGASGAETAATILRQEGIYDVEIVEHDRALGDHDDSAHKRLVLSRENFHGTSAAALGVAAHECGHAIQHQQAYAPLQLRMASVGLTTFASQIVLWLPLLGMLTGFLNTGVRALGAFRAPESARFGFWRSPGDHQARRRSPLEQMTLYQWIGWDMPRVLLLRLW